MMEIVHEHRRVAAYMPFFVMYSLRPIKNAYRSSRPFMLELFSWIMDHSEILRLRGHRDVLFRSAYLPLRVVKTSSQDVEIILHGVYLLNIWYFVYFGVAKRECC